MSWLDSLATWNIFNADFEYTIVNTASPTIYFNNLSSNYENLVWSFGDGTTSTNSTTHQYSSPGNYTVTLTIYTNSGCLIDSISQNIDIILPISMKHIKIKKCLLKVIYLKKKHKLKDYFNA